MDHPATIDALPEAARKVLNGPAPLKMMAARGMAPLPPVALVSVLYALGYDADEKLASAARATFEKLPPPPLDGALAHPELPAFVLDEIATRLGARPAVLAKVIQHAATAAETIVRLAQLADEASCELIATNEQRLLAHPSIIEALYLNERLRMSTADRLIELAARNGVELSIPGFKAVAASLQNELVIESDEPTPEDLEFRAALQAGTELGEDEDVVEVDEEGAEKLKETFVEEVKRIEDMKLSHKIRLALLGTTSQRLILVRSPHRVVALAAIGSPKMQGAEVEKIAKSTQVSEDVLRFIGHRKDWTGKYAVKKNLVLNPKTPASVSMGFLSHLRDNDLRALAKSKNLPQAVKGAVRQLLDKRTPKA